MERGIEVRRALAEFCRQHCLFIEGLRAFDDPSGKIVVDASSQRIESSGSILESDSRHDFHQLLTDAGFTLDRKFEGIAGLRVYRKPNKESIDVFLDSSWGRYDTCSCCVAQGHGAIALKARLEREVRLV